MDDAPVKRRPQAPPRFDAARWYLPSEPLLSFAVIPRAKPLEDAPS